MNTDTLGISEQKWSGMDEIKLTQMTIITTTVGKNPLEEMEQSSQSTKEFEMQFLGATSKTTETLFISKASHSISQ